MIGKWLAKNFIPSSFPIIIILSFSSCMREVYYDPNRSILDGETIKKKKDNGGHYYGARIGINL